MILTHFLKATKHKLFPGKEFTSFDNSIIPAKELRSNGLTFHNDSFYIQTAETEARRLIEKLGCTPKSRILEIGCGQGRMVAGLLRLAGPVNYTGLDVHLPSINWCRKYIESREKSFHFEHLDVLSERYNTGGKLINNNFRFDIKDKSIDIIYIWGVFTNMEGETMKAYLNDLKRMLASGGKVFFTAFVEENVPDISVNPKGYLLDEFTGPLQVVRYEKNYLFSLIEQSGLTIDEFIYGQEFDGQSEFYLS